VFIVADGALELVPFAALPESGKYLLESGPTFHVLTSARNLVAARDSVHATRVLLAVGNPDYDAGAVSTASPARPCAAGLPVFRPLPGSGAEASWVTGFWKTAGNPASPDSATSLIGRAATERAVRRDAPRAQVLHFATHGFVSVGSCAAPARDEIDRAAFGGLALAGANGHGAKSGADDGILTGEEIAGLDLDATDLAVLSACNSGAGEVLRGEGVAGLRRAFEEAGCRGLVMSLWPVQDESTQSWMRSLYRARFEKGLATDEAVRAASRALLDQRRKEGASTHPFAWAAFVAAGDWR
jgi:CHAT domain-containing protein